MFPRYLQYLLTDFRQTFVTGASRDSDELIRFRGQKVKVQGHTIAAEAHSTRRYRRVQLFLVWLYFILFYTKVPFNYHRSDRMCAYTHRPLPYAHSLTNGYLLNCQCQCPVKTRGKNVEERMGTLLRTVNLRFLSSRSLQTTPYAE